LDNSSVIPFLRCNVAMTCVSLPNCDVNGSRGRFRGFRINCWYLESDSCPRGLDLIHFPIVLP
jgi:hypothetical protein